MYTIIHTGKQPNFPDYVYSLGIVRPEDSQIVAWAKPEDVTGAHLIGYNLLYRIACHAAKVTNFLTYFPPEYKDRYDLTVEELSICMTSRVTHELNRVQG